MDTVVKIQISDHSVRWKLKQAAAERKLPLRELTTEILTGWLQANGYAPAAPSPDR